MIFRFGRLRFDWLKDRNHIYAGRHIEDLTREELIEAFKLACEAAMTTEGKQKWLARNSSGIEKLRYDLERRNAWKRIFCFFLDHEWTHFFGNEFTCHRCKKIRTRL